MDDTEHETMAMSLRANQILLERQDTELQHAEQKLRLSRELYRSIIHTAMDGFWLVDPQGHLLEVNDAYCLMSGYSEQELLAMSIPDLEALETPEDIAVRIQQIMEKGEDRFETRHRRKDCSVFEVENSVRFHPADGGLFMVFLRDVTKRKQTELALRRSETKLRTLYDSTIDAVMLLDEDGFFDCNQATLTMFGCADTEEFCKKHPADLSPPFQPCGMDSLTLADQHISQALAKGSDLFAWSHQRADNGLVFSAEVLLSAMELDGRRILQATVRDITERKKSGDALRESENKFSKAFQTSSHAITITKAEDGSFIEVNGAFVRISGFTQAETLVDTSIGLRLWANEEDRQQVVDSLREGQTVIDREYLFRKKNGEVFTGLFSAQIIQLGKDRCILSSIHDITDRKQAEEALRVSQQITTSIINAIPLSVFWKDKALVFQGCNTAFARDAGFDDPKDIVGKNDHQMIWRDQADLYRGDDRLVIESGRSRLLIEEPQTTPEGKTITLLTSKVPLYDSKGEISGILGAYMDITDRKQAEEKAVKLQKQLLHAQKMEAIGRLAGGIAHDFNNLLAVILSYTGFALETISEGDPLGSDLMEVKKAGERAAALTRQLLSFSRKQAMQPVALNLNQIVTGVEKMLRRILGEDIELVQRYATDLGLTQADPGQIEQVLMNLAVNARDAMPEGGKLTLETSNVEIGKEYAAHHPDVAPGSYVQLSVTDTGCGMDETTKARLFEPFFTTKDKDKGTGLGLSTVYGIVNQSDGHIQVFSELGHGTTFKVYLPRNRSATLPTTVYPHKISRLFMGTETILLTEDEEAVRNLTRRILRHAGYTVLIAANGGEGLLIGAQHSGAIHLLLTDVIMPRMSGKTLAQELLKTRPTLKILYMSGYTDNIMDAHGPIEESAHFIGKPFDAIDLTRKVRQILDG